MASDTFAKWIAFSKDAPVVPPDDVPFLAAAWNAAIAHAAEIADKAAIRAIESDGVGRMADRLAEVAYHIRAEASPSE